MLPTEPMEKWLDIMLQIQSRQKKQSIVSVPKERYWLPTDSAILHSDISCCSFSLSYNSYL